MIYPIQKAVYAGCCFGEWLDGEVVCDFDPRTNTMEVLGELFLPVFPRALPIELKGIAV